MSPEIENLIEIVKEGGTISDRQKEIILNKAKTLGENLDEIELVLETIPSQTTTNNQSLNLKKMKCPNCGAIITDTTLKCPECGYTFQKENAASEDARKCIQLLQEKLEKALIPVSKLEKMGFGNEEAVIQRQAVVINTFTLPSTKEGLLQLLEFSYSNYSSIGSSVQDMTMRPLRNAWYGKSVQALNALMRLGINDPEINSIISQYQSLIKTEKRKISGFVKYLLGLILAGAVSCVIVSLAIRSDNKALDLVSTCIENQDFSGAKAAAHKYSGDVGRLLDNIAVQEVNYHISNGDIKQAEVVAASINDSEKKESMLRAIKNVKVSQNK